MSETLLHRAPLTRWQGARGTYHLVVITGKHAERIAMHERLRRLEYGARRGFGSVKVRAQIGRTRWASSVFPQSKELASANKAARHREGEWVLLVSRKVMRAEDLAVGEMLTVELELL